MLKTYLYLPDELNNKIHLTAKTQNKSKAEIMRLALEKGIATMNYDDGASARAFVQIAEIGKKYNIKGPKDLSANMDYYLWGLPKRT